MRSSALVVVACIWWLTTFDNWLQRTGSVLTLAGAGVIVWQLISYRRDERKASRAAAEMGDSPTGEFYKRQLARQRDFHRGKELWSRMLIFFPGPPLFLLGFARAHPEVVPTLWKEGVVLVILAIAAVRLNLSLSGKYQRQIESLDRLQKEQS
jgi:hypothetical protein